MAWYSICLRVFMLLLAVLLPAAVSTAAPAGQGCEPPECYEPSPPPPPPSIPNQPPSGGSWSGYSDGRLNPDMAEDYSIWCANDVVEVWGGKPTPQLINSIPIVSILQLGDNGSFDAGAGMAVLRTGDSIVIAGSNGNNTPNPGSKTFSLSECIARNGGAPAIPPTPTPTATFIIFVPTRTPDAQAEAEGIGYICTDEKLTTIEDIFECVERFGAFSSPTVWYYLWWFLSSICTSGVLPLGIVAGIPAFTLWRRRRKNNHSPRQ
jgi:hypothetical protein